MGGERDSENLCRHCRCRWPSIEGRLVCRSCYLLGLVWILNIKIYMFVLDFHSSLAVRVLQPNAVMAPPASPGALTPMAPSAGDDLRAFFQGASVMDLSALHPLLPQLLRQLMRAHLPSELKHLLPNVGVELWSAV